ncbi:MAG: DUF4230 domain-containing protein [Bacteroidota bacterium]
MKRTHLVLAWLMAFFLWGCQPEDPKATIVSRIKEASKLSTVEYVITKVVVGTQEKRFLKIVKLKNSVFLANTEATLKLGVDLSKLGPGDVEVNGAAVTITLPPVEVINFSYPAESFEVDEEYSKDNWFNQFTPENIDAFYEEAEIDIREKINFLPLRSSAESKTRLLVKGLLQTAGYKEIYIDFDTTATDLLYVPSGQVENTQDN